VVVAAVAVVVVAAAAVVASAYGVVVGHIAEEAAAVGVEVALPEAPYYLVLEMTKDHEVGPYLDLLVDLGGPSVD